MEAVSLYVPSSPARSTRSADRYAFSDGALAASVESDGFYRPADVASSVASATLGPASLSPVAVEMTPSFAHAYGCAQQPGRTRRATAAGRGSGPAPAPASREADVAASMDRAREPVLPKTSSSADASGKKAATVVTAISNLFQDMKLDVRSTEIYLRVWRKKLAQMKLYRELCLYVVFVLRFAALAIQVIPVAVRPRLPLASESFFEAGHGALYPPPSFSPPTSCSPPLRRPRPRPPQILYSAMYCRYEFAAPEGGDAERPVEGALLKDPGWDACGYILLKVNEEKYRENMKVGHAPRERSGGRGGAAAGGAGGGWWGGAGGAGRLEDEDVVKQLVDLLARNAHEVWARKKRREGFMYGSDKIKQRKISNLLVPYECLSVQERVKAGRARTDVLEVVDQQAMAQNAVKGVRGTGLILTRAGGGAALLRLLVACGLEVVPPKRLTPLEAGFVTSRPRIAK
eukprot:tig00001286_g8028.t1